MNLSCWRQVASDAVHYDETIDHKVFFSKLVSIWRNQVQSINRRIAASKLITDEGTEYSEVLKQLPPQILQLISRHQTPFEIRKLIPKEKNGSWSSFEVSIEDHSNTDELSALFVPVQLEATLNKYSAHVNFPYAFGLKIADDKSIYFSLGVPSVVGEEETRWLQTKVFPALYGWIQRMDPDKKIRVTNRLLNVESYYQRYMKMKNDYGYNLCKIWTEKTDPQKYVFEDCGIASYLLETWSRTNRKPKRFADLGCGNGLLVHLLNMEGVEGVGLDIRERKIWKNVLAKTDLREFVVDPTLNPPNLSDRCDYLIGNHSDELSPYVPVMAARMRCEFFLLPCCPYDFHGKYNARPGKQGSTYAGFLEFLRNVCKRLGFEIEEDRLSIPSSKRLCIIGRIPLGGLPSSDIIEQRIQELLTEHRCVEVKPFVARAKNQEIRNCTNIPRDIAHQLTMRIFNALLEADPHKKMNGWRCGGAVPISEMIKILSDEDKSTLLKNQDGGFQTFLKNQHQAFHVYGGKVHIRNFYEMKKKSTANGSSKCWMLQYHPDGCLYGTTCKFIHDS